jgi:hypothetical protein
MTALSFNGSGAVGDDFAPISPAPFWEHKFRQHADEFAKTLVWQAQNESCCHGGASIADAACNPNPGLRHSAFANCAIEMKERTRPDRRSNRASRRFLQAMVVESAPRLRRAHNGFVPATGSRDPVGMECLNSGESGSRESAACSPPPRRAYRP